MKNLKRLFFTLILLSPIFFNSCIKKGDTKGDIKVAVYCKLSSGGGYYLYLAGDIKVSLYNRGNLIAEQTIANGGTVDFGQYKYDDYYYVEVYGVVRQANTTSGTDTYYSGISDSQTFKLDQKNKTISFSLSK